MGGWGLHYNGEAAAEVIHFSALVGEEEDIGKTCWRRSAQAVRALEPHHNDAPAL